MKTENVYISLKNEENEIKKPKKIKYDILKLQTEEIKRPIQIKITPNNSTNSFGILKYKGVPDKQIFTSVSKRINKYDPNSLINKKELIIDTRIKPISNKKINKDVKNIKPKKLNYIEFRRKKYQSRSTYRVSLKLKEPMVDYSEITHLNNLYKSLFENQHPNDLTISSYTNVQRPPVTNSLYTVLAMRKNQFMELYNQAKEQEKASLPKVKQVQYLVDSSLVGNIYGRKNDYKKFIDSNDYPFSYISLLNEDYSISEKIRFQKIMEKLTKLKKYIDENPKKDKEIIKEFILSNGIYDIEGYFDDEKLERFRKFLKGDFLVDPSKNIKETIIDILEGNHIHQPLMSTALDCLSKRKRYKSQKETIINTKKIEEIGNNTSRKLDKKKLRKYLRNNILKQKMLCQSLQSKSLEKQDLFSNLQRQKELYLLDKKKELDIVNKPKYIVDMLENTFREHQKKNEDKKAMTSANWCKSLKKSNTRLYGGKKNEIEYSELKKRNLLTEYICLMKARNNYEICKLKEKFNLLE